ICHEYGHLVKDYPQRALDPPAEEHKQEEFIIPKKKKITKTQVTSNPVGSDVNRFASLQQDNDDVDNEDPIESQIPKTQMH
ncbi:hypothetical protein KI387_010610, partial [Taxus chinensis]